MRQHIRIFSVCAVVACLFGVRVHLQIAEAAQVEDVRRETPAEKAAREARERATKNGTSKGGRTAREKSEKSAQGSEWHVVRPSNDRYRTSRRGGEKGKEIHLTEAPPETEDLTKIVPKHVGEKADEKGKDHEGDCELPDPHKPRSPGDPPPGFCSEIGSSNKKKAED